VPGAVPGTTGGPRNGGSSSSALRPLQSTLMVDIRSPSGRQPLDIGFFPTANLAQIQVQKGYVGALGPRAIGAHNLVTRKPSQPFEYAARGGVAIAGNGEYNGYNARSSSAVRRTATTRRVGHTKTDHWRLSDDSYRRRPKTRFAIIPIRATTAPT
jgi:iron complex outermembrane receptor protein